MKSLCLFPFLLKKKIYANSKNTKKKLLTYNVRFIDSARHMNESLSTLVYNLSGLNKCKCEKPSFDNIKITYRVINNKHLAHARCKVSLWREDHKLSVVTANFKCCGNVPKFLLLLRKGIYSYECMENMLKFNEKELPTIDNFHSNLNSSDISKADYAHAKKSMAIL